MRLLALVVALTTCIHQSAEAQQRGPIVIRTPQGKVRVWDPDKGAYVRPTPGQIQAIREAKARSLVRSRSMTDASLANALGIKADGSVKNESTSDYNLELGTWVGYLWDSRDVRVGPYIVFWRLNDDWKLTLDAANDYLGASLRYDMTYILRPSIAVGFGTQLDGSWEVQTGVSFRLW